MLAHAETISCTGFIANGSGWDVQVNIHPDPDGIVTELLSADTQISSTNGNQRNGYFSMVEKIIYADSIIFQNSSDIRAFQLKIKKPAKSNTDEPQVVSGELVLDQGTTIEKNVPSLSCKLVGVPSVTDSICGTGQDQLNTKLFNAVMDQSKTEVQQLLACGANPEAKDQWGCTPLLKLTDENCGQQGSHASRSSLFLDELIATLIDHGAQYNIVDPKSGETPLIKLVANQEISAIGTLLDYGPDVDVQDHLGNTALIKGATTGDKLLVQTLLDGKPNLKVKNKAGKTAYQIAKENGFSNLLEMLQPPSHSQIVEGSDAGGCTPSMIHIYKDQAVEVVLQATANNMFLMNSPGLGINLMAMDGESVKITVTPTKTGMIPFTCGIHGAPDNQQTHGNFMVM
jgi:hypothetical protein